MKGIAILSIGFLAALLLGAEVCVAQTQSFSGYGIQMQRTPQGEKTSYGQTAHPAAPSVDREAAAIALLEQLYVAQSKQSAKDSIREYALRRKTGAESGSISGSVSPADIREALDEINVASLAFAQRKFGIQNPDNPYESLKHLQRAVAQSPGLQALMEMFRQYDAR